MAALSDGELLEGVVEVAGVSSRYSRGGGSTNASISSSGSALGVGGDGRAGGQKYDLEYRPSFSCNQFHHRFTSNFCADILLSKNYKAKL